MDVDVQPPFWRERLAETGVLAEPGDVVFLIGEEFLADTGQVDPDRGGRAPGTARALPAVDDPARLGRSAGPDLDRLRGLRDHRPELDALFMLAGALVIDTGGQMSHGAIVAIGV